MTDPTGPLDATLAAMLAAPDDDAARLAFHARLAESELFLLLAEEPAGESLVPQVFALQEGSVVLVFDTEARLAGFAGAAVPYAALPGRRLVAMLAGQGVGLGVNFEAGPSTLLPAAAVDWLAGTLGAAPEPLEARPEALFAPILPPALVAALDGRLARAAGLAQVAWLARVRHRDGAEGHLLAIAGAAPGAEATLARAVAEAVALAGHEGGPLDVAFLAEADPLAERLARVGLRFDLPAPAVPPAPAPPGSDPARPPRLR